MAVINLVQFPQIDAGAVPTWQAVTLASDSDLAVIAAERDEGGVVASEFALAFALRGLGIEGSLFVTESLALRGPLRPELLVGLGGVRDVAPVDSHGLRAAAVDLSRPIAARGSLTAQRTPFAIYEGDPHNDWVLLDLRPDRSEILVVDTATVSGWWPDAVE